MRISASKRTFISVNHIICNIGCLKKLVKNIAIISILSIIFFQILNARKQNFMKNARKKTFNRWDMLLRIILIKLTLYLTEECQKRKNTNFLAKPPLKFK